MPNPTSALTSYRPDIGGTLMEYSPEDNQAKFIGTRVAPVFECQSPGEPLARIPVQQLLQLRDDARASTGHYKGADFEWIVDQRYDCKDRGFEMRVDDRMAKMYSRFFDAERMTAMLTRDVVRRNHEVRISALVAAGSFSAAVSGAVWSNAASSTPITDVLAGRIAMRDRTGLWPNALVITEKQFAYVVHSAQIIDRLKYNGIKDVTPDQVTANMLAGVFQVGEVLVAGAVKNTANPGQDTAVFADIWANTEAALLVLPRNVVTSSTGVPQLDIMDPCFARTMHWGEDGSVFGGCYETYYSDERRGEVVRHRMDVDEIVRYAGLCQRITGVLA